MIIDVPAYKAEHPGIYYQFQICVDAFPLIENPAFVRGKAGLSQQLCWAEP